MAEKYSRLLEQHRKGEFMSADSLYDYNNDPELVPILDELYSEADAHLQQKKQLFGFPDSFLVFESGSKINGFSRYLESYFAIALGEGAFSKLKYHPSKEKLIIYTGLFLYYHEYAHLMQERHAKNNSNEELMQSIDENEKITISHLKELDADSFASRQIGLRIIDDFNRHKVSNNITDSEVIEEMSAEALSGILFNLSDTIGTPMEEVPFDLEKLEIFILEEGDSVSAVSEDSAHTIEEGKALNENTIRPMEKFDIDNKTHPNQLVRIENIKQNIFQVIREKMPSTIPFNPEVVFDKAVQIAEEIMEWDFGNPVTNAMQNFRSQTLEIQNYLSEAKEKAIEVPELCLNQNQAQL